MERRGRRCSHRAARAAQLRIRSRDYAERMPERPLVVVLTGTDCIATSRTDADAQRSLELATRLVVLQEARARGAAARGFVDKIATYLPVRASRSLLRRRWQASFEIVVSGHLREEKDPFRAAAAAALTAGRQSHARYAYRRRTRPRDGERGASVDGAGAALSLARRAPHWRALRVLARSRADGHQLAHGRRRECRFRSARAGTCR